VQVVWAGPQTALVGNHGWRLLFIQIVGLDLAAVWLLALLHGAALAVDQILQ